MRLLKRKLCPQCKTGRDALLLDGKSPECPYLYLHDGKECAKFVEMNESRKNRFLKWLLKI